MYNEVQEVCSCFQRPVSPAWRQRFGQVTTRVWWVLQYILFFPEATGSVKLNRGKRAAGDILSTFYDPLESLLLCDCAAGEPDTEGVDQDGLHWAVRDGHQQFVMSLLGLCHHLSWIQNPCWRIMVDCLGYPKVHNQLLGLCFVQEQVVVPHHWAPPLLCCQLILRWCCQVVGLGGGSLGQGLVEDLSNKPQPAGLHRISCPELPSGLAAFPLDLPGHPRL